MIFPSVHDAIHNTNLKEYKQMNAAALSHIHVSVQTGKVFRMTNVCALPSTVVIVSIVLSGSPVHISGNCYNVWKEDGR